MFLDCWCSWHFNVITISGQRKSVSSTVHCGLISRTSLSQLSLSQIKINRNINYRFHSNIYHSVPYTYSCAFFVFYCSPSCIFSYLVLSYSCTSNDVCCLCCSSLCYLHSTKQTFFCSKNDLRNGYLKKEIYRLAKMFILLSNVIRKNQLNICTVSSLF